MSLTFCMETGKLKRVSDKPRPLKRPPRWQLVRALFPTRRTVAVADSQWPELLATPLFQKLHGGVDPRPGHCARQRMVRLFGELLDATMTATTSANAAPDAEGAQQSDEPPGGWRGLTLDQKQHWMQQRQARQARQRREPSGDRDAVRAVCRAVLEFEARRQLRAFGYALGVGRRRGARGLIEEYLDEVLGAEPSADVCEAREAGA
jgi:hypothetical protein